MPQRDYGMDLAAINIQRGRDHGIPPYNHWRRACGLTPYKSWSDMVVAMSPQSVDHLASVYEDVNDVDLFTGSNVTCLNRE
jgi:peroxidase